MLKFILNFFKEIINSENLIITRGLKLGFIPLCLRFIFKNKVIIYLGCTPINFVERIAFNSNPEYIEDSSLLKSIMYIIEPSIEKYVLRHADKFIVENRKAKKLITFYGAELSKIKVIPYYVQKYFTKSNKLEFNRYHDVFSMGYIGRFKKYDLLKPIIKAINSLRKEGYNIKLYMIGSGPQLEEIQNMVKQEDLSKVIKFLGSKSHKEVSHLIENFHTIISPMLENICPSTVAIKVLESVMNGKIVITSDSGNISSLFLDNKDLVLDQVNSNNLSNKIKKIIENYDHYSKISEKLRKHHLSFRKKQIFEKEVKKLMKNINFNH